MRPPSRNRRLAGAAAAFALWSMPAPDIQAATAYIIDEVRVSLRASPCRDCPILHQGLKSGARLEVSGSSDGWSRVTTADGVEGWVPSRYLTDQPIAREQLEALRQDLDRLRAENGALRERLGQADGAAAPQPGAIGALSEAAGLGGGFAAGATAAGDGSPLHAQNQELLKNNRILQSEVDVLRARLEQLESSELQRWFFYGGLLVALGALLSAVLPRLKPKRRGYSEWR
jgi:SH3 domain protein